MFTDEQINGINEAFGTWSEGWNASLNKLDETITKQIDESNNQIECQTLRWVLDQISELIK